MCENIDNYSMLEGDAINADLPRRLRYSSVNDRILAMADPTAMPGELELISTAKQAYLCGKWGRGCDFPLRNQWFFWWCAIVCPV